MPKITRVWILLLFFTIISCSSPLEKYREEVKEWEDKIEQFEQLDRNEVYSSDAVLFVGSSSILLWDTIAEDMQPYSVIQRGFGGSKLSDVAWFSERIIYPHQFKALVLFVGNDISGKEDDKTPEEVLELFKYLIKTVRSKYPVTPVFWIEVTPTESRWQSWPEIRSANDLILEFCGQTENVHFIGTSQKYLGTDGLPIADLFREDQLHLNRDGYNTWSKIIKNQLDQVLK